MALAVAGRVRDLLVPVEQLHPLAVDRDLELLALDLPEHRLEVAGDALHLERVFAVGRELVLDQHAAARAERQPFDVIVLRRVGAARRTPPASAPSTSPIARRLILPAADRYASISAGDIVSAPAMLSKPRVESSDGRNFVASTSSAEQIANRVRVFGAVQAVQARAPADA